MQEQCFGNSGGEIEDAVLSAKQDRACPTPGRGAAGDLHCPRRTQRASQGRQRGCSSGGRPDVAPGYGLVEEGKSREEGHMLNTQKRELKMG